MTTLLITRPEPQAEKTTSQLQEAGYTVIRAAMLNVVYHKGAADELRVAVSAEAPQAILITSQHSAQALHEVPEARVFPILTVGPASAEAAKEAGASAIFAADGDSASLLALTRKQCSPEKGPLIYLRAEDIAADLPGQLRKDGYAVVEILTYEARAVERLPDAATQALLNKQIDAVLFYSGRTAEIFLEAAAGAGLMPTLAEVHAVAIGETVAGLLRRAGWKKVSVIRLTDPETAISGLKALFSSPAPDTPKADTGGDVMRDNPNSPIREEMAEPSAESPRGWRQMRGPLLTLGAVALLGLVATGDYFYQKRKAMLDFKGERPSQHQFTKIEHVPVSGFVAPTEKPKGATVPHEETKADAELAQKPVFAPATTMPAPAPAPLVAAVDPLLVQKLEAMQKQIDEQSARLEVLEQSLETQKDENARLGGERQELVQIVQLRRLIEAGKPFDDALSDLLTADALSGGLRDRLATLQPLAAAGIASETALQKQFADALHAYETTPHASEKEGLWTGMKARLSTLVIVRKVGADHPGDDDGSVIARAEAETKEGHFERALKETSLLSAEAAPFFADYREAVRSRLKTLDTLDTTERESTEE